MQRKGKWIFTNWNGKCHERLSLGLQRVDEIYTEACVPLLRWTSSFVWDGLCLIYTLFWQWSVLLSLNSAPISSCFRQWKLCRLILLIIRPRNSLIFRYCVCCQFYFCNDGHSFMLFQIASRVIMSKFIPFYIEKYFVKSSLFSYARCENFVWVDIISRKGIRQRIHVFHFKGVFLNLHTLEPV